jgi:hypothetical protein
MQIFTACTFSVYGRLGTKHEHTIPHTSNKGLVLKPLKSFEDLQSVHKSGDNSSKHKKICH